MLFQPVKVLLKKFIINLGILSLLGQHLLCICHGKIWKVRECNIAMLVGVPVGVPIGVPTGVPVEMFVGVAVSVPAGVPVEVPVVMHIQLSVYLRGVFTQPIVFQLQLGNS